MLTPKMLKCIFCIILISAFSLLQTQSEPPVLNQIGNEILSGFWQSDFREVPLDQLLPLNRLPLEKLSYPSQITHPSLLFPPSKILEIRSRRYRPPYQEWLENIISQTLNFPNEAGSPLLCEKKRSEIGKANAFVWFLTGNRRYLTEAKAALLNISIVRPPVNGEGGIPGEGWGDWLEAAYALKNFALTYDLIFSELSTREHDQIEHILAEKINQIHKYYLHIPKNFTSSEIASGFGIAKNNHIIAIASDVATACLVISHPRARLWFDDSLTELQNGLAQIRPDGTYIEGPYYARFINYHLFPFFFIIHNICGQNLFKNPVFSRMNNWLIDLECSDGSVSLVDDSFEDTFLYKPIGIGLAPQSAELQFLFLNQINRYPKNDLNWIESFCAYQDKIIGKKPEYEYFYPDGGYAIFHGKNEILGTLCAEPDRNSISYHDHIEPAAFTLYALGHHFLIDGGYGRNGVYDKNRNWFLSSRAHNIPLVNGLGPNQNPMWGDDITSKIYNSFRMKNLISSAVTASYQNTEINRFIWLVNQDFFIVFDELYSNEKQLFSIPWNGAGRFNRITNRSVSWQQNDKILKAEFLSISDKPATIKSRYGLNSHSNLLEHEIAEVCFPISNQADLVSIFIPEDAANQALFCQNFCLNTSGKYAAREIVNRNSGDRTIIILADSTWKSSHWESDAKLALIQEKDFTGIITLLSASYLVMNGKLIFRSDRKVDLTYDLDNDCGYLDVHGEESNIEFSLNNSPGFIILNKLTVDFQITNDLVHFKTSHSGIFNFGKISSEIKTAEPVRNNLPFLQQLTSSAYPEEEFLHLSSYEKTLLRNEIIDLTALVSFQNLNNQIGRDCFLENLYRLSSGFFRSCYDSQKNFVFRIPQSFRFSRRFGALRIKYYEEGYYHSNGIHFFRHRLWLSQDDDFLFYSFNKDFHHSQYHSLLIKYRQYSSAFDWQQYNSKHTYQIDFRRDNDEGWLEINHHKSEFDDDAQNIIAINHKTLESNVTYSENDEQTEYDFYLQNIGRNHSLRLDSRLSDKNGLQYIGFSNSHILSPAFRINSQISWQEFFNERHFDFQSNLQAKFGKVNTLTSFSKASGFGYKIQNRTGIPLRNCFLSVSSQIDSLFYGELEFLYRHPKTNLKASLKKGKKIQLGANYDVNPEFNFQSELIRDISNKFKQIMFGFFLNSRQRIGLQFLVQRCDGRNLYGYENHFEISFWQNRLNIISQFMWNQDQDLEKYEIDISQPNDNLAPGILISYNNNELLRCEGYLSWRF